ncbi:MAG TPA: hypothetical protein VNL14_15420 [Candidatus Acidoferrales bacterium]|nr:hypothetical protein [Candidatus Acidoferrales bacterium]
MSGPPGKTIDPSFWLALFFTAVVAVWVVTAARFDWDTRLFPWAIGIPALLLALRQLVGDWRGSATRSEASEEQRYRGILDISVDRTIPPEVITRHTLRAGSWILGFAAGIWLLGFLVSIPLFIFLYLICEARASRLVALAIAGLMLLFVWIVFDQVMHLAWPEAALLTLIGH